MDEGIQSNDNSKETSEPITLPGTSASHQVPPMTTPITWEIFSPSSPHFKSMELVSNADFEPQRRARKPKRQRGQSLSVVQDVLEPLRSPPRRRKNGATRSNHHLLTLHQSIEALREENDYLKDIIHGAQERRDSIRRAMQSGTVLDSESSASSVLLSPLSRTHSLPQVTSPDSPVPIIHVALKLKS